MSSLDEYLKNPTREKSSFFDNIDRITIGEFRANLAKVIKFTQQEQKPVLLVSRQKYNAVILSTEEYQRLKEIEAEFDALTAKNS